jgi:4-hydroxy-2-oxoheptanedioate aldolase
MLNHRCRDFRLALKQGPCFGPFVKCEDPGMLECIGHAGFDFCVLDMEHGPHSIHFLQNLVRAAESCGLLPIVRIPEGQPSMAGAALDVGAVGVQLPQIGSAKEAEIAIKHARFAPKGQRGVCRFVRAAEYGSRAKADYFQDAEEAIVVIQLEGKEALGQLEDILEVPGIDVLFVGPYDLSQSLGITGQVSHPLVRQEVMRVASVCRAKGVTVGMFVETVEQAHFWRDQGIHYLCYSVDVGLFQQSCALEVSRLRCASI